MSSISQLCLHLSSFSVRGGGNVQCTKKVNTLLWFLVSSLILFVIKDLGVDLTNLIYKVPCHVVALFHNLPSLCTTTVICEQLLPGVMIVPITIGSRNSVTIHGSGKCAGFVMVISDPPYRLTFFSPNILAVKEKKVLSRP